MQKILTTPVGELRWAKVLTPDSTFDDDGVYSIEATFKTEEAKDLISAIDQAAQNKLNLSQKSNAITSVPYEHIENGLVRFKFKQKAKTKNLEFSVDVFDNANKKWDVNTPIGNGSKGRVAFSLYEWEVPGKGVGCSAKLKAVQIIEHVAFDTSGADFYGFEAVEGSANSRNEVDIPF